MDNPFINFLYPQNKPVSQAIGAVGNLIRKLPLRSTVEGTASGIGTAAQIGGMFLPKQFGLPLMGAGTALQMAAPALGNEAEYAFGGAAKRAEAQATRPVGTQAVLNGKPVYWSGKDWQQLTGQGSSATLNALNAPGVQNRFIQDSTPGGSQQERAYREAGINAAQQAASNPLFQKYQVADLTKQYNEAKTPEQRQSIGLQIWAQTNPQLAAKLKQGQTGYVEAQSAPGMSNAGGNLFSSLPMPSANFSTALSMQPPVTMNQPGSTFVPGANMVSFNPMAFDTQATADMYKNPIDMGKIMAGAALNTDPRSMNITQDQRRALINQYNQGLINRPFPPATK